jgi:hypothetical protein
MSLQAKFDQTMSRADNLLREKLRREEAALEAENAAQRRADAEEAQNLARAAPKT